ncbi:MAG: fructosamine kinase family protein [Thermosynechococcaceae cyanobacterium]
MWDRIQQHIQSVTGMPCQRLEHRLVGGGCINQAYCLTDGDQSYFVKLNQASQVGMFEAEALGLQEMVAANGIRVPRPLCWGVAADRSYIAMEWLDLGRGSPEHWSEMGRGLAQLHRATTSHGFGWQQPNTIGATPQINPWTSDWATFFRERRIGYQLQLAQRRGGRLRWADALLAAIPQLLTGHNPEPSLVHGDLWSGNAAFTPEGEPVIFDPAVYYGDREVDLAMTELFGGFPAAFYQGYQAAWPLAPGYEQRKVLYNLYHILNHFNLFGGSYGNQAEGMIQTLLR